MIDDATYPKPLAKRKAFTNAIASGKVKNSSLSDRAAIIILSGTVDLSDGKVTDDDHSYFDEFDSSTHKKLHGDICYEIGANKAIIGVNDARIAFGGLTINGHSDNKKLAKNIIIQNIDFWDSHGSTAYDTKAKGTFTKNGKVYPYADAWNKAGSNNLGIGYGDTYNGKANIPENIWIDHCTFSDGKCDDMKRNFNHDGALDIPFGKNITISYCEFTNHDKVSLIGSNPTLTNPDERQVTFHHIYYHKVTQRNPLCRASKTHVYNNFYDNIGIKENTGYAVQTSIGAQMILENNYFGSFKNKIFSADDGTKSKDDPLFARIFSNGNNKEPTSSNCRPNNNNGLPFTEHLVSEPPFQIPYEYTLEDAANLNDSIPKAAGAKVIRSVIINGKNYAL